MVTTFPVQVFQTFINYSILQVSHVKQAELQNDEMEVDVGGMIKRNVYIGGSAFKFGSMR